MLCFLKLVISALENLSIQFNFRHNRQKNYVNKKKGFSIFYAHGMIFSMRFKYFVHTDNSKQ